MQTRDFTQQTKRLIDSLKAVCANFGLGNDGNEFKIITQVFLYKFLNDKFGYEVKQIDPRLQKEKSWEVEIANYSDQDYQLLLLKLGPSSARLKPEHFLSYVFNHQNEPEFAKLFDDTLRDIAIFNADIFSVKTGSGAKVALFDEISQFITDSSERDNFCKALISPLINFSFEQIFDQKFDFFSTIFEYLIKDYNKDGGGKYAEYYTPHAVAKIMAAILVTDQVQNVTCYDPAAGSGTLLMNLAHAIGEDRCSIYSQDISQKSTGMLRLNLVLNNLIHSIQNIIQGNTLLLPYHKEGKDLKKFDYIVSNPPFKLDFSDFRNELDTKANHERFFAGIPNVPNKDKDKMAIYLVFIQHIIFSLSSKGKAAIVVPTGFLTAQSGIERAIREKLVEEKMLRGVISMPSNIFATTGTNVSILFLDKANTKGEIVLMDASKLGKTVKEGKNQKTLLSTDEEQLIITTFNQRQVIDDFSVVVGYEQIRDKDCFIAANQYFETKNNFSKITQMKFIETIENYQLEFENLFMVKLLLENIAKTLFEYWFLQFDFPNENGRPYNASGGCMVWNSILKMEIPDGWRVEKLGDVLETKLGGTPSTDDSTYWEGGNIAWISSGEMDFLPIKHVNTFITEKGLENSPAVLLPKGSVVISLVRYIRVSILGISAATNQSVVGIKETRELKNNYIFPFLQTRLPDLMTKRRGAQQPHINKGEVDNVPLIIPSARVLEKYYEISDPIFKALTDNKLSVSQLNSINSGILHKLKNGQVLIY